MNCSVASNSAIKAVDFEKFDDLFGRTWLEKDTLADYSYFKKCANETIESYFSVLKEQIEIYYKLRAGYSLSKLFELYLMFKDFKFTFNKNKNFMILGYIKKFSY